MEGGIVAITAIDVDLNLGRHLADVHVLKEELRGLQRVGNEDVEGKIPRASDVVIAVDELAHV